MSKKNAEYTDISGSFPYYAGYSASRVGDGLEKGKRSVTEDSQAYVQLKQEEKQKTSWLSQKI